MTSRPAAVTLVPRDQCLRENLYLAHAVAGWQQAHALDAADDAWVAAMRDEVTPEPAVRWAESMILYLPTRRIDQTAEELGPALERLLAPWDACTLTFLHALRNGRWPTRRRGPPVLADSAARFRAMGAGKRFNGGILVAAADAAAVLSPLLPAVRMDIGYGPVYLAADGGPFVASVCQYLNLHVDLYAPGAAAMVRDAASAAGFAEWTDGICDERITPGGRIPGCGISV